MKCPKATSIQDKTKQSQYNYPPDFRKKMLLNVVWNTWKTAGKCHQLSSFLKPVKFYLNQPWDYNESLDSSDAKRVYSDATLLASKCYKNKIRESVLNGTAVLVFVLCIWAFAISGLWPYIVFKNFHRENILYYSVSLKLFKCFMILFKCTHWMQSFLFHFYHEVNIWQF